MFSSFLSAPKGADAIPQFLRRQGHQGLSLPDTVGLQPVAAQCQQQPAASHRPAGQQQWPLPQPSELRELPRRVPQGLRREVRPQIRREKPPGRLCRQDSHRPPPGIPEAVAAVIEGGNGNLPAIPVDAQRHALFLHPLPGRRPEDDAQQQVGRNGGDEQHPQIHTGIEDAPLCRHPTGEEPQRQHAARHAAGEREKEDRPPKKSPLPAEGDGCQQEPRRQLPGPGGHPSQPRQKDRRRVASAEDRRQEAAPSPCRDPGEELRPPQKEVIHQGIQQKHAVQVHHRHPISPSLPHRDHYTHPSAGKTVAKGGQEKKKRHPA